MKSAEQSIEALRRRHHELAEELYVLERRAYLTPDEQRQASDLKKHKLATKDRIVAIEERTE